MSVDVVSPRTHYKQSSYERLNVDYRSKLSNTSDIRMPTRRNSNYKPFDKNYANVLNILHRHTIYASKSDKNGISKYVNKVGTGVGVDKNKRINRQKLSRNNNEITGCYDKPILTLCSKIQNEFMNHDENDNISIPQSSLNKNLIIVNDNIESNTNLQNVIQLSDKPTNFNTMIVSESFRKKFSESKCDTNNSNCAAFIESINEQRYELPEHNCSDETKYLIERRKALRERLKLYLPQNPTVDSRNAKSNIGDSKTVHLHNKSRVFDDDKPCIKQKLIFSKSVNSSCITESDKSKGMHCLKEMSETCASSLDITGITDRSPNNRLNENEEKFEKLIKDLEIKKTDHMISSKSMSRIFNKSLKIVKCDDLRKKLWCDRIKRQGSNVNDSLVESFRSSMSINTSLTESDVENRSNSNNSSVKIYERDTDACLTDTVHNEPHPRNGKMSPNILDYRQQMLSVLNKPAVNMCILDSDNNIAAGDTHKKVSRLSILKNETLNKVIKKRIGISSNVDGDVCEIKEPKKQSATHSKQIDVPKLISSNRRDYSQRKDGRISCSEILINEQNNIAHNESNVKDVINKEIKDSSVKYSGYDIKISKACSNIKQDHRSKSETLPKSRWRRGLAVSNNVPIQKGKNNVINLINKKIDNPKSETEKKPKIKSCSLDNLEKSHGLNNNRLCKSLGNMQSENITASFETHKNVLNIEKCAKHEKITNKQSINNNETKKEQSAIKQKLSTVKAIYKTKKIGQGKSKFENLKNFNDILKKFDANNPRNIDDIYESGYNSDDELFYVYDSRGHNCRVRPDQLANTECLKFCWKCGISFQSSRELFIHYRNTNHV